MAWREEEEEEEEDAFSCDTPSKAFSAPATERTRAIQRKRASERERAGESERKKRKIGRKRERENEREREEERRRETMDGIEAASISMTQARDRSLGTPYSPRRLHPGRIFELGSS